MDNNGVFNTVLQQFIPNIYKLSGLGTSDMVNLNGQFLENQHWYLNYTENIVNGKYDFQTNFQHG